MRDMFKDTALADPDVSDWNVSSLRSMHGMFQNSLAANPNVSNWVTTDLVVTDDMFDGARRAVPDLRGWDVSSLTSADNMLGTIKLPIELYDEVLINWSQQTVEQDVVFGAGDSQYCNGEAARLILTDNGWTITDDGFSCDFGLIFRNGFESQ